MFVLAYGYEGFPFGYDERSGIILNFIMMEKTQISSQTPISNWANG